MSEAAPIRKMQEEICECKEEKEVQRSRLANLETNVEAKLSKQHAAAAALESKVDLLESRISQQAEKLRHNSESQPKLPEKQFRSPEARQSDLMFMHKPCKDFKQNGLSS
eukprot:Skav200895  [mRNA]  locus=scaffold1581:151756:153441:+ [translate_table: standard]